MSSSYRDLAAWKRAKALAVAVYRVTEEFPKSELFGLTSQMRRAAVSIAANLAEGQGRATRQDFARFIYIARGSLLELETHVEIAQELGMGKADGLKAIADDCYGILGLLNRLLRAIDPKREISAVSGSGSNL